MEQPRSSHPDPSAAEGASRKFYETLAARRLDRNTLRGIAYRNHIVARHLAGRNRRVLEIGPGEGGLTRLLGERGHRVVAVDLARPWLAVLPRELTAGATVGDVVRLPFADASFDAVAAAEVFEHVPDLRRALEEAKRVLRPGGRLVLTVPYRETLQLVTCPKCGHRFERNGHVHTFDERTLDAALREADLRPERRFVGPTRLSREILRRLPLPASLPILMALDRATYRCQRVSDTWMLAVARRP